MTNGEAINWIINISADIGKAEHRDLWHYEQALSEIRDMLQSAQPEPQWIPVTERLPKERSVVLVTDWRGNVYTDRFIEEIDTKPIWRDIFSDGVLAWMPLPEPYQGES